MSVGLRLLIKRQVVGAVVFPQNPLARLVIDLHTRSMVINPRVLVGVLVDLCMVDVERKLKEEALVGKKL